MTARHEQLFWFIYDFYHAHQFYPTQDEMMVHVGCSITTIMKLLRQLEARGYIERESHRYRNVRIIKMMGARA